MTIAEKIAELVANKLTESSFELESIAKIKAIAKATDSYCSIAKRKTVRFLGALENVYKGCHKDFADKTPITIHKIFT